MIPIDPWSAAMRIDRAGRAKDHYRGTMAPGVEDRHARVHEPDIRMKGYGHRLFSNLAITVGDRHGVLFMKTDHHLRIGVAEIIHNAVMTAAIACARDKRDIFQVQPADDFGDHI